MAHIEEGSKTVSTLRSQKNVKQASFMADMAYLVSILVVQLPEVHLMLHKHCMYYVLPT